MIGDGNPPLDTDAVLAALQRCDEADRDSGGGWHETAVVEQLPDYSPGTIRSHLNTLEERGDAVKVWGVAEKPRQSFLPADHPDAPTETADDGPEKRAYLG